MISTVRTALVAASLLIAGVANASTIIDLNSDVYGQFHSVIDESVASSASVFVGRGSDYGITGQIVFTDNAGVIRNVLGTTVDNFYWSWTAQQNNLIGTMAVASAMSRVELLNGGVATSYMADINAMNGNLGFCCSVATQRLDVATSGAAVPEPGSLLLTGAGLLGLLARRKKRAA